MTSEYFYKIVKYLKNIINNSIYENHVYAVGGCCRDILLNHEIKDIDLVIDLPNGGIEFANWLYNSNLLKEHVVSYPTYGTAMFKLKNYPDIELEAVQTRNEEYINRNSRKPSTAYGTIKEDCMRRDLTSNAIYYNITEDKFLDICGNSFNDIKNHIIRTPCDPNITYIDDPLRILRCVRFASRYEWMIESSVFNAMICNIDRLSIISAERITDEFNKILNNDSIIKVYNGINTLWNIGAFKYIFPNIQKNPSYLFNSVNSAFLSTFNSRLAIMLILINDVDIVKNSLYKRKYSSDTIKYICKLHKLFHIWKPLWEDMKQFSNKKYRSNKKKNLFIRRFSYECGNEKTKYDLSKIIGVFLPDYRPIMSILKIRKCDFYNYKLPINGDDIIKIGIKPGKEIAIILDKLLQYAFKYPDITIDECIYLIMSGNINNDKIFLKRKTIKNI